MLRDVSIILTPAWYRAQLEHVGDDDVDDDHCDSLNDSFLFPRMYMFRVCHGVRVPIFSGLSTVTLQHLYFNQRDEQPTLHATVGYVCHLILDTPLFISIL